MTTVVRRTPRTSPPTLADLFLVGWPFHDAPLLRESPEMRVETYLDGSTLVVKAEIPGVDPDRDVDITVRDGMLTITAERREVAREELPDGYRSEFRYGSFVRRVALPEGVSEDDVKATYADGILEVRVPVGTEVPEPKKVPVTRT